MFSLIKYMMVLVVGLGLGYWFGTAATQPVTKEITSEPAAMLAVSQSAQNTEKAVVATPSDQASIADNPQTDDHTQALKIPNTPDPFAEIAELEKAPADPSWNAFLQQHYDETTQQILKFQTDYNKQLIKDFQQSEIDHQWAALTEQKLKDFYFLQPDQQLIETTKIHCRQNGCEISGVVSKKGLLSQVQEDMRQLAWAEGRSFSFSTTAGGQGKEKFYMLLLDLPKD